MRNTSSDLVSVIMNCHNGEKYLKKSINSLKIQTHKNWELIFWNNCSNDRSKKIIKSYKDKRIKYFENEKLISLYKARNLAIKKTRGKFICFLDTDDWWVKTKLRKQLDHFYKNKNISLCYSNFYFYDQLLKKKKIFSKKNLPHGKITKNLFKKYDVGILTVMIKKKILKKKKFNSYYNIIGDFDLFINLSVDYEFGSIQQPLAYYRVHKKNFSKLNLSLYNKEISKWIKNNGSKFRKLNYSLYNLKILYLKNLIKNKFSFLGNMGM